LSAYFFIAIKVNMAQTDFSAMDLNVVGVAAVSSIFIEIIALLLGIVARTSYLGRTGILIAVVVFLIWGVLYSLANMQL
jgi:hypothetical protein